LSLRPSSEIVQIKSNFTFLIGVKLLCCFILLLHLIIIIIKVDYILIILCEWINIAYIRLLSLSLLTLIVIKLRTFSPIFAHCARCFTLPHFLDHSSYLFGEYCLVQWVYDAVLRCYFSSVTLIVVRWGNKVSHLISKHNQAMSYHQWCSSWPI